MTPNKWIPLTYPVKWKVFELLILFLDEDGSNCWEIFQQNIEGYIILNNLQRPRNSSFPDNNTSFTLFPTVKLNFISSEIEYSKPRNILNLHEKPYVYMFLGVCEVKIEIISFQTS